MRAWILAVALLAVPFVAGWSISGSAPGPGRSLQLIFDGTENVGDYSDDFTCNSEQGCRAVINGTGTFDLVECAGTDCTTDGAAAANYVVTNVTGCVEGLCVTTLRRGNSYRFQVAGAPSGSGVIYVKGN